MLPERWRLVADPATRRSDRGRIWMGGSPFRIWQFDERGAAAAAALVDGSPIGTDPARQRLARRLLDAGMAQPEPTPSARPTTDVTVVIPFRGRGDELAATLAQLAVTAQHDPTGPVVVVDDGSPDAAAVAEVAARFGARLVRHPTNRGPGAARDTGWREADTEVVAFVDAGCLPDEHWLPRLLPHLDDPDVAAVAPRIPTVASPALPAALAAYEAARPSLDRGALPGLVRPRSRIPFVPTATLVARRSDLEAVGGFDESMRWGEDVDLVWRLVAAGRAVRYEPAATVGHTSRASAPAWLRQRFDYGASAAPLARRHHDAVQPLGLSRRIAAACGVGLAAGALPGLAVAAGTTVALERKLPPMPDRWPEALRLSAQGHRWGAVAVADALRRPWWPILAAASLAWRRARRVALAVAVVPPVVEWATERPSLDPVRWVGIRLLDDLAYGAGVWAGCWRDRSAAALRPALTGERRRRRARS